MKIYQLSREYYPFACAGGLKEVVTGLAESYAKLGHESSTFLPCYGYINKESFLFKDTFNLNIKNKDIKISVYYKKHKKVDIYLLDFSLLNDKKNVYTYTLDDELKNPLFKHGSGFLDNGDINIIFQIAFLNYVSKYLPPPDILNLHDGHTGLVPAMVKSNTLFSEFFINTKLFFTIHNAGLIYHQRMFATNIESYKLIEQDLLCEACFEGSVDPLCLAVLHSTPLTVSPYYADEILSLAHEGSSGNFGEFCNKNSIDIIGITNGVKIDHYAKLKIKKLPSKFKKMKSRKKIIKLLKKETNLKVWGKPLFKSKIPMFLFQNRITEQKGVDKFINSFKEVIALGVEAQFFVMGQGEDKYEKQLIELAKEYSERICYIQGYDELLALNLFLASDFFILTSLWEPCGLTDFEAQLAGSIPIVNKTGGLQKVENGKTGFVYQDFALLKNIILDCETMYQESGYLIEKMKKNAYKNIKENYTWDKVVTNSYIPLFLEKYDT